jgi:hypothetical protein
MHWAKVNPPPVDSRLLLRETRPFLMPIRFQEFLYAEAQFRERAAVFGCANGRSAELGIGSRTPGASHFLVADRRA